MKGIKEAILNNIGTDTKRVNYGLLVDMVMLSDDVSEENVDFRREKYKADITSCLNSMDFYSDGEGGFAHLSVMTQDEKDRVKNRLLKTINSMNRTVKRLDGQSWLNFDTGEIEFPDAVTI